MVSTIKLNRIRRVDVCVCTAVNAVLQLKIVTNSLFLIQISSRKSIDPAQARRFYAIVFRMVWLDRFKRGCDTVSDKVRKSVGKRWLTFDDLRRLASLISPYSFLK